MMWFYKIFGWIKLINFCSVRTLLTTVPCNSFNNIDRGLIFEYENVPLFSEWPWLCKNIVCLEKNATYDHGTMLTNFGVSKQ